MRIIAGELKGRRLKTPLDERVRPTTDKVKEAVFSIIMPWLSDSIVVDMFAGTGNLGLEAVSRGAAHVYFADRDRQSIALIRENVSHCKVEDRCTIICTDYKSCSRKISSRADIIFLDPPYDKGILTKAIDMIIEEDMLEDGGIIVAEHSASEILPDKMGRLTRIREKKYGKIGITIYENSSEEEENY